MEVLKNAEVRGLYVIEVHTCGDESPFDVALSQPG
jgi:hypothetical protein